MSLTELIKAFKAMPSRPRVGLALAGGTAYGIAHIGVLRYIEELGLPIDLIVGTSAGSVVGAFWASGVSSQKMYRMAKNTEWWFLAKPVMFKSGLMSSEGIETWMDRIIREKTFADLNLEFAVTATDFRSGELVVIREGSVANAARISCTLPGIYQPVEYKGRALVDGGLVENLPANTCLSLGADIIIGVDLHSNIIENDLPKTVLLSFIHATNILQRQHELVQLDSVDVLISPKVGSLSPLNFKAVDQFVDLGYDAAQAGEEQLSKLIGMILGGAAI